MVIDIPSPDKDEILNDTKFYGKQFDDKVDKFL